MKLTFYYAYTHNMCMKKFWNSLNELKKSLIMSLLVTAILMILSIVGIIFGQVGWLIGVAIGGLIQSINIVLYFKGADFILRRNKAGLFLILFFARMLLIVGAFVLCIALERVAHIGAFTNSIFGVLIGITPTEIILMITVKGPKAMETK